MPMPKLARQITDTEEQSIFRPHDHIYGPYTVDEDKQARSWLAAET